MLQLSQRPLTGSVLDAELFVDRASELVRLERAISLRLNTLVLGEPGIGVTSLAHRLAARLVDSGMRVRYINASTAETTADLINQVHATPEVNDAAALHEQATTVSEEELSRRTKLAAALAIASGTYDPDAPPAPPRRLTSTRSLSSDQHTVLIVDGLHEPAVAHGLFGRRRDDLWELPHTWVACGDSRYRNAYLQPPADSFFDDILEIGPLTDTDAESLLRRRIEQATATDRSDVELLASKLTELVAVARGNPRRLLAGARQVLLTPADQVDHMFRAAARLQAAAAHLGSAPAMLVTELEALGPSSASDQKLLKRMGWTRARAAQVLQQLEKANIVKATTSDRDPDRPGRPKKLYELNYEHFTTDRSGQHP